MLQIGRLHRDMNLRQSHFLASLVITQVGQLLRINYDSASMNKI